MLKNDNILQMSKKPRRFQGRGACGAECCGAAGGQKSPATLPGAVELSAVFHRGLQGMKKLGFTIGKWRF